MTYSLYRAGDGVGDSGQMCEILDPAEGYNPAPGERRPKIGCGVRVGSIISRSYQAHDWWQTTPITEILIDQPNYMKFRTRNSIYEWKEF